MASDRPVDVSSILFVARCCRRVCIGVVVSRTAFTMASSRLYQYLRMYARCYAQPRNRTRSGHLRWPSRSAMTLLVPSAAAVAVLSHSTDSSASIEDTSRLSSAARMADAGTLTGSSPMDDKHSMRLRGTAAAAEEHSAMLHHPAAHLSPLKQWHDAHPDSHLVDGLVPVDSGMLRKRWGLPPFNLTQTVT